MHHCIPFVASFAAVALMVLTLAGRPAAQSIGSPAVSVDETSIDALQAAFAARRLTCRSVVEHYLQRIDAYDKRGPRLNAVVAVHPRILFEADRLDAALRGSGPAGPLHCVLVLVKDAFETAEMPTTFGSAAFRNYLSGRDATVVARLRNAGALVIAKSTLGEFASGYAGSISGPIRNPYDLARHPSGSSGGTGAGIAADFATVGIGGDTGGSVRGPAAAGSLVGHRPTLPLVSRYGSVPFKPSYDTTGPITRTVKDAALVMDVIAGYDPNDSVTAYAVGRMPSSFSADLRPNALEGVRIGVVRQPMQRETDTAAADHQAIRKVFGTAIDELRAAGATLVENVTIPDVPDRTRASYEANIFETEGALDAYFAGLPNAPVKSLRALLVTAGGLLPWRARALINTVGRTQNEEAYLQVLRKTEETRRMVLAIMANQHLDAFVYPSADHYPARIALDIMTNPDVVGDTRLGSNRTLAAVLGWPAVTVPGGFTVDGMPVGVEFMGRAFDDARLLGYAYTYEQATHHRRPPTTTPRLAAARGRP